MSLVARNNANPVPKSRSRRRKIAYIGVWFVLVCICLCALLWVLRTTVSQWVIRNALLEQGIDADLSVTSVSGSELIIDDIHLSVDGDSFFSAARLRTTYNWRDALKGQVTRLEINRPTISVEVEESGKIIRPNLPVRSGSSSEFDTFPPQGILINDAKTNLISPFGDVNAQASGTVWEVDRFDLSGTLVTEAMTYDSFAAQATSTFTLTRDQEVVKLNASAYLPDWGFDNTSGRNLSVDLETNITWTDTHVEFDGPIRAKSGQINSTEFLFNAGSLSSNGSLSLPLPNSPENTSPIMSATWGLDLNGMTLTNPKRRQTLAETLTLNASMSGISATAPFAPQLTAQIEHVFEDVNIEGAGRLNFKDGDVTASLGKPFQITKDETAITLTSLDPKPFYKFDKSSEHLALNFNADIKGAYSARLSNARLEATSFTGLDIETATDFSAGFQTRNTWRARTNSGRQARLAPLNASVNYKNENDIRHITMTGALDYDGDIPGGYVTGLKTRGDMRLRLQDDDITAWFTPSIGSQLKITEMDTVSDWFAKDVNLTLISSAPIYKRGQTEGLIKTTVTDGSGILIHKTRNMDLTFDFATADISGIMTRRNSNTVKQVWDISASNAHMLSDTIPAPGTDIRAPKLAMTATLEPGKPLYFTAHSPAVDVTTPQMSARNLQLSASGTSENLIADYETGDVIFAAMPLPPFPVAGTVEYSNGAWSGDALTHLERAKDTPIGVNYRFENGRGSAKINVTDLPFTPRGLQPKHLLPIFGGKVAQVQGMVDAEIDVGFGGESPMTASARTSLKNMSMGTLPGPIAGLNADLVFSSLFPLTTEGPQTLTLGSFDPGLPLEKGDITFELIPDGIQILAAKWPLGDGYVSLDPTAWLYTAPENRVTLRVDNVSLGEFLQGKGGENFKVTGDVTGVLPVVISGVSVLVEDGILSVKNGGVIQYSSPQTNGASKSNEVAGYAFDALKNFEYKSLEAKLNGPLDGDIDLNMVFLGRNKDVLGGAEFLFNVGIQGQLFNIARSFQTGKGISATVMDEIAGREK